VRIIHQFRGKSAKVLVDAVLQVVSEVLSLFQERFPPPCEHVPLFDALLLIDLKVVGSSLGTGNWDLGTGNWELRFSSNLDSKALELLSLWN
jgi:hypothetical protein